MILVNLTTQPRADRATLPSLEMGWDPFNINFGLFASFSPLTNLPLMMAVVGEGRMVADGGRLEQSRYNRPPAHLDNL